MNEKIQTLFGLKDQIDNLNTQLKDLKEAYDAMSDEILQGLAEAGVDKMALTGFGSVTAKKEVVANVQDWDAFFKHIAANQAWYLLQRRPAVNACREAWAIGDDIPGAVPVELTKLSVTKSC